MDGLAVRRPHVSSRCASAVFYRAEWLMSQYEGTRPTIVYDHLSAADG